MDRYNGFYLVLFKQFFTSNAYFQFAMVNIPVLYLDRLREVSLEQSMKGVMQVKEDPSTYSAFPKTYD